MCAEPALKNLPLGYGQEKEVEMNRFFHCTLVAKTACVQEIIRALQIRDLTGERHEWSETVPGSPGSAITFRRLPDGSWHITFEGTSGDPELEAAWRTAQGIAVESNQRQYAEHREGTRGE